MESQNDIIYAAVAQGDGDETKFMMEGKGEHVIAQITSPDGTPPRFIKRPPPSKTWTQRGVVTRAQYKKDYGPEEVKSFTMVLICVKETENPERRASLLKALGITEDKE